ncbi:hypothetical protein [Sorangium sp. So ce176]|uniref:hypothetical protein n=1 Tax=Sorangium sp. So ce176 TaxID=3133286 RepID=UPI003F5E7D1A
MTDRRGRSSRVPRRDGTWMRRGSAMVLGLAMVFLLGCTSSDGSGAQDDGAGGAPEATSAGAGAGATPCEERSSQEDCEAQPSPRGTCSWEVVHVSSRDASCDALREEHRCLTIPAGGPGACAASPECGQLDGLHLLYREVGGTIELHRFDGVCGFIPVGWMYCDWNEGELTEGPSSCACSCPRGAEQRERPGK